MLDSHWIPRLMPDTAEATKQVVRIATITTSTGVPISPTQPLDVRPLPIWRAPRPNDAAVPNSVAKIARMLMNLPTGPSTIRMPKSEVKAAEMSCLRPRR